jgi:hypothetical protein
MAEHRVYFVIRKEGTAPTALQWIGLFQETAKQPFAAAVVAAANNKGAHNRITRDKYSRNAAHLRNFVMVGFEIADGDGPAVLAVLDAQAAIRGITGSIPWKIGKVFEGEFKDAALALGYPQAQVDLLNVESDTDGTFGVVGYGDRATAIPQAQQYLADNPGIWYE